MIAHSQTDFRQQSEVLNYSYLLAFWSFRWADHSKMSIMQQPRLC